MTMEGSSSSNMDEKKQRRMEANRVSARKSRIKKQQLIEDLKKEMLEKDFYISMLNARIMGLEDQVRTRDFLLQTLKEVTGVALDSASIHDLSFEIPDNVFGQGSSGH